MDLTGMAFGEWRVMSEGPRSTSRARSRRWLCRCNACGTERLVAQGNLRSGLSRSCGCIDSHGVAESLTRTTRRYRTSTYKSWQHMRDRCLNPRNKDYAHYGGRGITICSEWDSYARFLEDMGPKPSGMTLDRIDNDESYNPTNCRWATRAEQTRNRRATKLTMAKARTIRQLVANGVSQSRISDQFGIAQSTVSSIVRGRLWRDA